MQIHLGDALEFPMLVTAAGVAARPWHEARPDVTLMGNLPFNVSHSLNSSTTRKIVEGTRSPFYTIGRSSLPAADTLTRRT